MKSVVSKLFRNAVLELAEHVPFARSVMNSGRLSLPCTYDASGLNGPDCPGMPPRTKPGSPCPDVAMADGWLLPRFRDFTLLTIDADAPDALTVHGLPLTRLATSAKQNDLLRARYLGEAASAVYLIRPDQHVAARWQSYDADAVAHALGRALSLETM
jgi:3-(3-hydroxy-phenyl)propionate hydroxylase